MSNLYEQGICPSVFNPDHKLTFSISKHRSWSPTHYNLTDLVRHLPNHNVVYMRVTDKYYDYDKMGGVTDPTMGNAEAGIEMVVKKVDRELPLRTALARLLPCEKCGRLELLLLGVDREGRVHARCRNCGAWW